MRRILFTLPLLLTIILLLAGCGALGVAPARTSSHAHTAPTTTHGAVPPRTLTYVAIGASDAFGVGTDNPTTDNWPTVLSRQLGDDIQMNDSFHLINLGIPGEIVGQSLQNELPIALASHPNLVTIWLSVNDFAGGTALDTYQRQLTSLLASLRQHTTAHVYIANLPDLSVLPAFSQFDPSVLHARIQQWNAVIAATAASEGATLVDLSAYGNEIAQHPEYIGSDGFHPSTIGAIRLAEVFDLAIIQSGAF
ncbi:MAG: SGNH/GDSL hydrolase family protein [Ktedonobacterales bacterium]